MIFINEEASVKMQRESIFNFFSLVHLIADISLKIIIDINQNVYFLLYARILLLAFELFQ